MTGRYFSDLFAVALFFFVSQLAVGRLLIVSPTASQDQRVSEASRPAALLLCLHVLLPVRPSLMLDSSKALHQSI